MPRYASSSHGGLPGGPSNAAPERNSGLISLALSIGTLRSVKVELLYWAGCPSYPEVRELLEDVLEDSTKFELREVKTQEDAEVLHFPGSPTIRVDGVDIDPEGALSRPALACRIYHLANGAVSPVPSREMVESAVR
jgi:hypothetical protein